MKKHRQHEIIGAAFGEETVGLGRLSDREQRELDALRTVSEGLKGLRDVPECQLSNDRLRNAILSDAVQRRSFSGWGLATATVICGALAVLAFQARLAPVPDGKMVVVNVPTNPVVPAVVPDGALDVTPGGTDPVEAVVVQESSPEKRVAFRGTTRSRHASAESHVPEYMRFAGRDSASFDMTPVGFDGDADVRIEFPSGTDSGEGGHDALVVVDADHTTSNGAYKATEVSSYGDVVFGG